MKSEYGLEKGKNGSDTYGFSALPAGMADVEGDFDNRSRNKIEAISVRCIED